MPSIASRRRGRRAISEINMVPFIDVMLVLLIIFMVTAPLIAPSMIDLPSVGKAAQQPEQIIQIIVNKNDSVVQLKVKGEAILLSIPNLAAAVKRAQAAQHGTTAVVISADKNVKYESVIKVLDTLQRAGIARIGLSVQLLN